MVERELDKEGRKVVHDFVREELQLVESLTVEGGRIKLKYCKNLRKMDPKGRHKYVHFTLYKHGIDTFNALFRLSKAIGCSEKIFSTAGLKDKRGHTTQRVSIYNTDVSTLQKFYKQAGRNREIWIEDFSEFQDDKVEVGGLSGNQFGLILRLKDPQDASEMLVRVESLKNRGMVNYFGLQRFGQFATKTYEFGVLYAKRAWKELVESVILSDCNNEQINSLKRDLYEAKRYGKAERELHNKYKIEKLLFRGLTRLGENYQNVFESLPRSIKTLYTHSLQSYIWNRLASRRIQEHGLVLRPGDIVGRRVERVVAAEEETSNLGEEENEAAVGEVEEELFEPLLVTETILGSYTIADVVLPLLGPQT
jgi:tRNA pseudouridine13 synthase